MSEANMVQLGDHLLPVVPQRHARLRRNLTAKDLEAIFSAKYASETYRLLTVLIPALKPNPRANPPVPGVPLWEWEGYASQEAMDQDNYDEALDRSPTTAEMVDAFEKAIMVSGADRLGKILGLVETMGNLTPTPTED